MAWFVIGKQNLLTNRGVGLQHGENERVAHTRPLGVGVNQHVLQVTDRGSVRDHSRQSDEATIQPSRHNP